MAFPKLLQKLFQGDGGGDKLREDIIPIDAALSDTSTNAVQNKVVQKALDDKLSLTGGTMTGNIEFLNPGVLRYLHNRVDLFDSGVTVDTGTDENNTGARIILRSPQTNGEFGLIAKKGDVQKVLYGASSGTLTWESQSVAIFQSESPTSSLWHAKFKQGLILQGNNYHITNWGESTVTLPIAFQTTNYIISVTPYLKNVSSFTKAPAVCVMSQTTTSFTVYAVTGSVTPSGSLDMYISYACIGY